MCIHVQERPVHVSASAQGDRKRMLESPGAEVKGRGELYAVGARKRTQVLCKSYTHS